MKRRVTVIAALAALLALTCAAHAGSTVRIGLTLGLTGRYADIARMQKMGFETWKELVNRTGGITAREVEMVILDDEGDPGRAAELYEQLITREKGVEALILCGYLDESVALRREMDRAGWYPKAYYATVGPATCRFRAIVGRYSVDDTGRQSRSYPLITQWQGEKRSIVWPLNLRTSRDSSTHGED